MHKLTLRSTEGTERIYKDRNRHLPPQSLVDDHFLGADADSSRRTGPVSVILYQFGGPVESVEAIKKSGALGAGPLTQGQVLDFCSLHEKHIKVERPTVFLIERDSQESGLGLVQVTRSPTNARALELYLCVYKPPHSFTIDSPAVVVPTP